MANSKTLTVKLDSKDLFKMVAYTCAIAEQAMSLGKMKTGLKILKDAKTILKAMIKAGHNVSTSLDSLNLMINRIESAQATKEKIPYVG